MNDLEQLMTERHEAFTAAAKKNFRDLELTLRWREANRRYVQAARNRRLRASTGCTEALGRNEERRTADRASRPIPSHLPTDSLTSAARGL